MAPTNKFRSLFCFLWLLIGVGLEFHFDWIDLLMPNVWLVQKKWQLYTESAVSYHQCLDFKEKYQTEVIFSPCRLNNNILIIFLALV